LDELVPSRPYSQIFNFNFHRDSRKNNKRHKLEIYYDILNTFYTEEHSESGKSRQSLTKISSQVNMPYNRFKRTLSQLNNLKLCNQNDRYILVTEKGLEFIKEYESFNDYLKQIGLVK